MFKNPACALLCAFFSVQALSLTCVELLRQVAANAIPIVSAEELKFTGVGNLDVYNPTAPFQALMEGKPVTVIAARVEARDKEHAQVIFFQNIQGTWTPICRGPHLQDPFVAKIDGMLVTGGVQVFEKPEGGLGYKTVFFRGNDLSQLKAAGEKTPAPSNEGPPGMKDIRLLSLSDGKILVSTRPQGGENGPGRVGFRIIKDMKELTPENILAAKIVPDLFAPGEWGGVNEMHLLKDGRVGVLGHIARYDEETPNAGQRTRHYYPIAFIYDPKTGTYTTPKILAQRSAFSKFGLSDEAKRPDLKDVLFSGGLVRHADGTATLYVGAGDAKVVRVELGRDPFVE